MEVKPEVNHAWSAMRPALETMVKSHLSLSEVCEMFAKAYVDAALKVADGNITRAAGILSVHRNTLYRYVDRK